jgi:catechol 2,3-dioxygenase
VALSPDVRLGPVHLTVADLERSLGFYRSAIGLDVLGQANGSASLGAGGRELLVLIEEPGARPAFGYTGLFHFALLVPSRRELARWLAHAARERVPLSGLSDHFVSEALYLSDPDGHGIEIYADRPRALWEGNVGQTLTTEALDVDGLLGELEDPGAEPFAGLADGTIMGHVHLRVATIPETVEFYRRVGFDLMAEYGAQAAFLAAGGYHHHLGANVWQSAGAQPPPAGTAALRHATLVLPDAAQRDAVLARVGQEGPFVEDPSGNRLLLEVADA